MRKFTRSRSGKDILRDRYINGFQKSGFINDDIIKTTDRDFWKQFKKQIITDTNVSSIFESILVAYQKVPYSESVIQKIILQTHKDEDIYKTGGPVFARTSIFHADIYRCFFVYSPINFAFANQGVQIRNTLKTIEDLRAQGYTIEEHVVDFLNQQLKLHKIDADQVNNTDFNLFAKEPVTILVPELVDGAYYNINDSRRYPVITEAFHYNASYLGQIRFMYKIKYNVGDKEIKKKKYQKYDAYFHVGHYTTNDNGVETDENKIFYVKFFSKFYNPFLMFDKDEIAGLMNELITKYNLTDEVLSILNNTYNMYIDNIDKVRENYDNTIPSISISKPGDQYYDNVQLEDELELLNNQFSDDDDEDDIGMEEVLKEEDSKKDKDSREEPIEEPEPEAFRVSRQVLSLSKLKSLILGYNQVRYYGFYAHLNDNLFSITDINKGYSKGGDGSMISSKQAPKSMQLVKTIASNPNLFMTNTDANWLDTSHLFDYRKDLPLIVDSKKGNTETNKTYTHISISDRFQTFGETNGKGDYGVIDPVTLKSETASGTAGSVSMLNFYKDSFVFTDDKKYRS